MVIDNSTNDMYLLDNSNSAAEVKVKFINYTTGIISNVIDTIGKNPGALALTPEGHLIIADRGKFCLVQCCLIKQYTANHILKRVLKGSTTATIIAGISGSICASPYTNCGN